MSQPDGLELAESMVNRVLEAGALEAQAHHSDISVHEVNFNHERMSLVRSIENSQTQLTAYMDGRRGTSSGNTRNDVEASIAIERAFESAKSAEPDPGHATAMSGPHPTIPLGGFHPRQRRHVKTRGRLHR